MESTYASEDMVSIYNIYRALRAGVMQCWLIATDGDVNGTFLTENIHTTKGWHLNVPFCGIKDNSIRSLITAWNKFESIAKEWGYTATKFVSSDTRFASIASRRGYRARYVEYIKEL